MFESIPVDFTIRFFDFFNKPIGQWYLIDILFALIALIGAIILLVISIALLYLVYIILRDASISLQDKEEPTEKEPEDIRTQWENFRDTLKRWFKIIFYVVGFAALLYATFFLRDK